MFAPDHAHHVALLISVLLISLGIKGISPYSKAKKWIKEKATIQFIEEDHETVRESQYLHIPYYFPNIEYAYDFHGTEYTNNLVSFERQNIWTCGLDMSGNKLPENSKPWNTWELGTVIDVYIDPNSPNQSVLFPVISKSRLFHHLAVIIGGCLVFSLWFIIVYTKQT